MEKEVMHITSVNNISRAYVKFVFSRRMEYHVTNTFLQVRIIFPIFHIVQYHFVNFCVLPPPPEQCSGQSTIVKVSEGHPWIGQEIRGISEKSLQTFERTGVQGSPHKRTSRRFA